MQPHRKMTAECLEWGNRPRVGRVAEIQRFAEIAPRWPDIEVSPLVTQQEGKLRDQGQDARCLPLPQGHRDGLKKPSSTAAIATKY